MGESKKDPLRLDFDRQLKLEFHGWTVTSDAGLLAYRELDDALALTCNAATGLHDTRTGQNTQHSLLALLRPSIFAGINLIFGIGVMLPDGIHLGKIGIIFTWRISPVTEPVRRTFACWSLRLSTLEE